MSRDGDSPFDRHHDRYDGWFERHAPAYESELGTVRAVMPRGGRGLAIGVGTGRFAAPLGVGFGVDPSRAMLDHARRRGIAVVQGVAEALPLATGRFDLALCVTTICFVDDIRASLMEARRVLRAGGTLLVGFIDRDSRIGREYRAGQHENVFYRGATFVSAGEIAVHLAAAGFQVDAWRQCLTRTLTGTDRVEASSAGTGEGAFVVACAVRRADVPSNSP
jgi:SAM-dependent methyltransferase